MTASLNPERFEGTPYRGKFYKYREAGYISDSGEVELHKFTKRIITHNELYFADPRKFNDPFEFLPAIEPPSIQALKRRYNNRRISKSERKEAIQKLKEMPESELNRIMDNMWSEIMEQGSVGVCSFSKDPDNLQMWSYYSNDHNGVCFGFDTALDEENQKALLNLIEVKYQKERSTFKVFDKHLNEDKFDMFYIKHVGWKHENEIRQVAFSVKNDLDRRCRYNSSALTSLIFGCKTDPKIIESYAKLLSDNDLSHVKLKTAKIDRKMFKLNIEDL